MTGLPDSNQVEGRLASWVNPIPASQEIDSAIAKANGTFKQVFKTEYIGPGGTVEEAHKFRNVIELNSPIADISEEHPVNVIHYNQVAQEVINEWSFWHTGYFSPINSWPKRYFRPLFILPNYTPFDLVFQITCPGVFLEVPDEVHEAYYMMCAYHVLDMRLMFDPSANMMKIKQGTVEFTKAKTPQDQIQSLLTSAHRILDKYRHIGVM